MTEDSLETPVIFDEWSFQHLSGGAVIGSWGLLNVWQYILLHTLFEVWENTTGIAEWKSWGWKRYEGDSILNMAGDTLSGTAGFYLMNRALDGKRASTPLLLAILGMGAAIAYNHPEPVDEDFFADKVAKGIVTLGVISVVGISGYLFFKREVEP